MSDLAKLRWRCRRGMRELDALMLGWLDTRYSSATTQEIAQFSALLELQDPVIMDMIKATSNQEFTDGLNDTLKNTPPNTQHSTQVNTQGRDNDYTDYQPVLEQIAGRS